MEKFDNVVIISGMENEIKRDPFKTRIHEIDLIRGILMCLVIMDHLFNLFMSFNGNWMGPDNKEPFYTIYQIAHFYWHNPARTVVRYLCLGSFCFISGISCAFSRSNWKRAVQMIVVWFAILVVSNLLESMRYTFGLNIGVRTMRVDFNIIGVLAWSTLIYCFFENKSWKWIMVVGIIGLLLHPICYLIANTEFGKNAYAIPLWRPSKEIADQADFLPLFPYLGFFFGGALLSRFTYSKDKKSYFKQYEWERPFCFVGRHSLIIYGAHFLILIALFSFVGLFIK